MKKVLFFGSVLASFFIIYNLSTSIYTLLNKKELLLKAQNQLDRVKQENKDLEQQLKKVESNSYIEEVARTRLFLGRPDEKEIVLPLPTTSPKPEQKKNISSWRQWVELFR